ncbi:hypothetical protein FACS1894177_08100 [Bacteroidia bacterium]|nr:hypothetical protein FACS1894177_08100 [Bacteroidia bacterium]
MAKIPSGEKRITILVIRKVSSKAPLKKPSREFFPSGDILGIFNALKTLDAIAVPIAGNGAALMQLLQEKAEIAGKAGNVQLWDSQ